MKHLLITVTVAIAFAGIVTASNANTGDLTYAAFIDSYSRQVDCRG